MTLDEIVAELTRVDAWKVRAGCASAAERAAPLFRKFGRPESLPAFQAGLAAAWAAVASRGGANEKRVLRRLPEADADDSHNPEYFAGQMLGILFHALDYASTGTIAKATLCIEHTASLCDGIDVTLTAAPGQTFRYDPKNPPPPGELETKELRAQADVLELLRDASAPSDALIAGLRRRAQEHASMYEAVVPGILRRLSTRE